MNIISAERFVICECGSIHKISCECGSIHKISFDIKIPDKCILEGL